MRKVKRLRIANIIIFICIVLLSSFLIYFLGNNNKESVDKLEKVNYTIETTSSKEENTDVVKEIFAEGMNTDEFLKTVSRKENYVESENEYKRMEFNFEKNLRYSELEEYLYNLNSSDIVKLEIIGESHDNRSIYSMEIGMGDKTIMFDANMHAAEVAGTYFLLKYVNELVDKYENGDSNTKDLLEKYKIAMVPSVNPDGFDMTQFGVDSINNKDLWVHESADEIDFSQIKSNANGVDINRNFPTQNAGLYYEKYDELINTVTLEKKFIMFQYFGGTEMGSEPETKAMIYFFGKHYKNAYSYVNLHSAGRVIYVGKPNLSDEYNEICQDQGEIIKNATDYTLLTLSNEEVGEGNDGTASDFMAELANDFKFSTATKRLSNGAYDGKVNTIKYKYCATVLETLGSYSKDMNTIEEEWIYRNFNEMFNDLVKQG